MTNREFYDAVIKANLDEELTAFAEKAIEALDAKNEKRRNTQTKEQKANEELKAKIMDEILTATAQTASYVGKVLEVSTQKASSLLQLLEKEGKVVVSEIKEKGKSAVKGYALKA